jgi:hypothetical protein
LIHQSLLGARVALREALCACALQIITILNKLRVFLPVKIKIKKLNMERNSLGLKRLIFVLQQSIKLTQGNSKNDSSIFAWGARSAARSAVRLRTSNY